MSEAASPAKQPAPIKWVLANPGSRGMITLPGCPGIKNYKVTNDLLKNPKVVATIAFIEQQTGAKIFNNIVVKG